MCGPRIYVAGVPQMVDLQSSWPWNRSPKRYAVPVTSQVGATLLLLLSCFCYCSCCCGCVYLPTTHKTPTVPPAHNVYLVSICSYPVCRKGYSAAETKQNKRCLADVRFENVFAQACQPLSMCTTPMRVPSGLYLCCIAHKTKNAVRTITSNVFETRIWSKSSPQKGHSILFALSLAPCSPSKPRSGTRRPEELDQVMMLSDTLLLLPLSC